MALTESEKIRVQLLFDQLDHYKQQKVLSSQKAFEDWLYDVAYSIYRKVKDWLNDFWSWLFG